MKSDSYTAVLSLVLVLLSAGAEAGTIYDDVNGGHWTNPATWNPAGVPGPGDTAVIDSHEVNTHGGYSLTNTIANVRILKGGTFSGGQSETIHHYAPLSLEGGTYRQYWNADVYWDGPVNVASNSTMYNHENGGSLRFTGNFSGTGTVTLTGIYAGKTYQIGSATSDNGGFSGNWNISNQLLQAVGMTHPLGSGKVFMSGGSIQENPAVGTKQLIANDIVIQGTGQIRNDGSRTATNTGTITVNGQLTSYHRDDSGIYYEGPILASGSNVVYCCSDNGTGLVRLDNTNNAFGILRIGHTTRVIPSHEKTLTGAKVELSPDPNSGARLDLAAAGGPRDWALTNVICGKGQVTVEDGSGNYFLVLAGGVLDAGANSSTSAILNVQGGLGFTNSAAEYGQLLTHIITTNNVAGADYDRVTVSGSVKDLGKGDLNVNIATNLMPEMLAGQGFTVLTCANDLAGRTFRSVLWPVPGTQRGRWRGDVEYGNGYVKISNLRIIASGTLIVLQ